jgi:hypothetical protein
VKKIKPATQDLDVAAGLFTVEYVFVDNDATAL